MLKPPDFLYVGVQRAGSTFVGGYFDGHPDVVWQRKVYENIWRDELFQAGQFSIERDVPDGMPFIEHGEMFASGLTFAPDNRWDEIYAKPGSSYAGSGCGVDPGETARRLKKTFPSSKVILSLRNQIDWFRTHYRNILGTLPPRQHRFCDYLATLEGQYVLNEGHFDRIVETYFDLFGRGNVHVGLFEDIRDNERAVLEALCAFVGVRYVPYDRQFQRYNRGPSDTEFMLRNWLASAGISLRKLGRFRPLATKIRQRLPARMPGPDPISKDYRRMIAALYGISNQRTARLIGRDLSVMGYPW